MIHFLLKELFLLMKFAILQSMLAKLGSSQENGGDGDGGSAPPAPKPKKAQTIEKMYQKKSQLEHILLRPDTYIGSVEKATDLMWIYNSETKKMEQKQIEYVPGKYVILCKFLLSYI